MDSASSGFFFMMMIFKGIFSSMAGPVPNYDMQRILATKSPVDAAKMSGIVSLVMFLPRYMLVAGLTVLALVYLGPILQAEGKEFDFELILPYAINNFMPVGLVGILIAGLLAAFMSTFAASVNAAPVYFVNDIYKKYINSDQSEKAYLRLSYYSSFTLVAVGVAFGFLVDTINDMMQWIFGALFGGYAAANVLKWYWWRFNSYGFFWGMVTGLIASLFIPIVLPNVQPLYAFPYILLFATIGSVAGTLLTPPDEEAVLISFYKNVRPWGFWKPIKQKVLDNEPDFPVNKDLKRDIFNIIIGVIWQMTLVVIPIYLVIREYMPMAVGIAILFITSFILKKNWLEKLKN